MIREPSLGEQLDQALTFDDDLHVTLGQISHRMAGREIGMLLLVVSTPFLIPIPTPGLSTPFGLALALLGLRYLWGSDFHLPRLIRDHELSPKTLRIFRRTLLALSRKVEWMVHPRLDYMLRGQGRIVVGVSIVSASLALAVPGPGSNVVPALALILLALGVLARDGVFLIAGAVCSALAWLYVALIGLLVFHGFKYLHAWFS